MTRLSVNLNKIALLRNSRNLGIPSVTRAANIALDAGAAGITVHPRPDSRHIRLSDVHELAALLADRPDAEFNIEGNPFEGLVDIARKVRPHQCTLVPDDPGAFTSDHGWDVKHDGARLRPVIAELKSLGTRVSMFMDPLPEAMPRLSESEDPTSWKKTWQIFIPGKISSGISPTFASSSVRHPENPG